MKTGAVDIDFIGHAGFVVKYKNKVFVIDPYHVSDNVSKADIILITHSHSDHCSIKDIQKLSRKGTMVLCPVDCQSTLMKVKGVEVHIVEKDDVLDFKDFKIECLPAYTINKRHSQSEGWLGYLLKFDKQVIYFAGDTDNIPEIKRLSGYGKKGNNFVVVLPVAGDVVMNAITAADTASLLNPTLAIPMSYGAGLYGTVEDAKRFVELCRQRDVNALVLDKI
ncbi:MBL fold metallo-hydrolase [Candidatus Pacearchaeota archaeon]|nr:MBL fold metallo-hydrolase [Candidatus Pacearchaeota archaeon]